MTATGPISAFANRHAGADFVVCGCGASLNALRPGPEVVTIGVNDVGRLFTPDYLVVLNPRNQFRGDRFRHIDASSAKAVFSQLSLGIAHPNFVRFRLGRRGGTEYASGKMPYTSNSPYVAVCLAAFMGARRIGLIGVDFTDHHFFAETGAHPLCTKLETIDQEYGDLRKALAQHRIELVNLSAQSRLTSLPKDSWDTVLGVAGSRPEADVAGSLPRSRGLPATRAKREPAKSSRRKSRDADLRVVHVARTNCAGALWNLHDLLGGYTSVQSRVITASTTTNGRLYPRDVLLSDRKEVARLLAEADLIHFHNWIDKQSPEMRPFRKVIRAKPAVLQFHSEPNVLQQAFPGRNLQSRDDVLTLVVAQKQARFFPQSVPVPNAININAPLLVPNDKEPGQPIRVVYAPTDKTDYGDHAGTCRGKGYARTKRVLQDLHRKGVIEAIVQTDVPWPDLMALRRNADVVIDECVTGGYHLTSLEGLSQGLATIALLDDQTRTLLSDLTGSAASELPWLNTPLGRLQETLSLLADNPRLLALCRDSGRQWMERFWAPDVVAGHYVAAYERAIREQSGRRRRARSRGPGTSQRPGRAPGAHHAQRPANRKIPLMAQVRPSEVSYKLPGRADAKRSEDFPQVVRLGADLLARRGTLSGQPCHILGNGPSVREFDLSTLQSRAVIGVSASPLLHDLLGRPTDYYCVTDTRFLQDEASRKLAENSAGSVRVFAGYCHGFLPDPDINYVRICGGDGVSDDLHRGFFHDCSVVLFAAQLAMWLGSLELYLHGCEFDYGRGRFYKGQRERPHDRNIYPRVSRNAAALARLLNGCGGTLNVVGPSKLVGDFGERAVAGIRRAPMHLPDNGVRSGRGAGALSQGLAGH